MAAIKISSKVEEKVWNDLKDLAKTLKKAPPQIAAELAEGVNKDLAGIRAVATGPYLNFKVERELLAFAREGDVDGSEAPRIWFDWLRHGRAGPVEASACAPAGGAWKSCS